VIGTTGTANTPYVGRFAPSPTGPLHFGSLLAAAASYLQARCADGRWLVRIEDIDPPREQPGSSHRIIAALEHYGFEWHGPVIYQSASGTAHRAAMLQLLDKGLAYHCGCSRSDLADAELGPLGIVYPGTCRDGCKSDDTAVRIRTTNEPVAFDDGLQGRQEQHLESESGDFVIWRRDGLVAYHLAVVVDDFAQGVTEVVRGSDLLDSTPRQIWLQRQLGYTTPRYLHIPVVLNIGGQKLSKATGAAALPLDRPGPVLADALQALGQQPPASLRTASVRNIWDWATENWQINALLGKVHIDSGFQVYG